MPATPRRTHQPQTTPATTATLTPSRIAATAAGAWLLAALLWGCLTAWGLPVIVLPVTLTMAVAATGALGTCAAMLGWRFGVDHATEAGAVTGGIVSCLPGPRTGPDPTAWLARPTAEEPTAAIDIQR